MRTLYQTLERLALELPSYGDISQTSRTVALIFHDEILYLPWSNRHTVRDKLADPRAMRLLITLVLREMQRHARAILLEQGHMPVHALFVEGSAKPAIFDKLSAVVQRVWDGLGQAPAWLAFESQIDKVVIIREASS